jgi:uncharacterized damage-inducible protein DinB
LERKQKNGNLRRELLEYTEDRFSRIKHLSYTFRARPRDWTMKTALAPGAKAPALDFKKSLLESFGVNEKANQLLISNISDAAWQAGSPTGKGRSIVDVAAHIHHVRLMWLSAADKNAKVPAKLDPDKATREQVLSSLKQSAAAIEKLMQKSLEDPAGKVPNFRPDVVSFVGYLIAHDAHHRGQIAMMARQVGHPVPPKVTFGLWEWGTLWKECGYGSESKK